MDNTDSKDSLILPKSYFIAGVRKNVILPTSFTTELDLTPGTMNEYQKYAMDSTHI